MSYHYSDPKREEEVHALPNVETFEVRAKGDFQYEDGSFAEPGWYWWACFPGCLPDSEPSGPFESEEAALADAQNGGEE